MSYTTIEMNVKLSQLIMKVILSCRCLIGTAILQQIFHTIEI